MNINFYTKIRRAKMKKFTFKGNKKREISFPLGGIGTGCIGLCGNGHLANWEITNRQNKQSSNGLSFFAIKAMHDGKLIDARVLQSDADFTRTGAEKKYDGAYTGYGYGPEIASMEGVPHFPECDFTEYFPFASLDFEYEKFPAKVNLTAFNPFLPLNDTDSGIPAAFFEFEVTNTSEETVDYSLCGVLNNFLPNSKNTMGCSETGSDAYIYMYNAEKLSREKDGNLCIATDTKDISFQEYLYRGSWFDSLNTFWNDFCCGNMFVNREYDVYDKKDQSGVLCSHFSLAPKQKKTIKYVIAWHFPYYFNYWNPIPKANSETDEEYIEKNSWRNYYAQYFDNSAECASYCFTHWDRLKNDSMKFTDVLLSSTLPERVLEAVSANLCILKSPVCLRLDDGSFWGWEGSMARQGSCEGSCIHVWNYAYALPFLFPNLERSMTENHFKYDMDDYGGVAFRTSLPRGRTPAWMYDDDRSFACADGQFGLVIKVYRDFKISGDLDRLIEDWYYVSKCMDYAFDENNPFKWDTEKTGVLSGRQHNTLDTELYSPNSWLDGMYLTALKAASEMAATVKDKKRHALYSEMFEKGKKWLEENLWNGSYYIQKLDISDKSVLEKDFPDVVNYYWNEEAQEIKYQIANGSSIDQLLGQWHADLTGLGEIFDSERTKTALASMYSLNFKKSMRDFFNPCRLFCMDNDAGIVICTYPDGVKKPVIPAPYSEECMNGFEYEAAELMIKHGMVEQGLEIVEAIRRRYDGEFRNPFSEMECGSDYARSMASYGLLNVCSGFEYDTYNKVIGFSPIMRFAAEDGTFRCFFCLESGYGYVEQGIDYIEINMLYGSIDVRRFNVPKKPRMVLYGGRQWRFEDTGLSALLDSDLTVSSEKKLTIIIDV